MLTTVQERLDAKEFMSELKRCGWVLANCVQETQPSQVNWKHFHVIWRCMYIHTPCDIIYINTFHSNTYKLQVPATFTVQLSRKRPQRTLVAHTSHRDSSDSTSSCGNSDRRFMTLDTLLWGASKFPPTPTAGRVDAASHKCSSQSHSMPKSTLTKYCMCLLYLNVSICKAFTTALDTHYSLRAVVKASQTDHISDFSHLSPCSNKRPKPTMHCNQVIFNPDESTCCFLCSFDQQMSEIRKRRAL